MQHRIDPSDVDNGSKTANSISYDGRGFMDKLTPERRSVNMARIRSKDTMPEMLVRRLIHGLGYRYRLHAKDLPGTPDLVFRSRKKVIFIHGCFWHQHADCREGRVPSSRQSYWMAKLARNKERDRERLHTLTGMGWKVLVLWECQLVNRAALERKISVFLGQTGR
jgi:DNA mismatch endonuclease (patch repair protein)